MEISIEKTIEIFQGMKKGISPWYPEEYYNFAIDIMRKYQKIEQIKNDSLYDIYMAGVNMTGEYQGCWVRFKDIENIVNEHFSGGLDKNSQKLENPTTTNDLGVDYISKQEVVGLMMHIWGKNHSGDDAMQECIDAIREMPSVTLQEPKWIPVSEMLPECGKEVLTISNYGNYEINHIIDDNEWFYDDIVAWMPLPQPYREVEE